MSREPRLFDADDLDAAMNEILVAFFVPCVVVLVGGWAAIRLYLGDFLVALSPVFAEPITPADGPGALGGGLARFLLLLVVSAVVVFVYILLYVRFAREPLRKRGWV